MRQRFKLAAGRRLIGAEIYTSPGTSRRTPWPPKGIAKTAREQRQLIHLHWVAKLIDQQSFFESLDSQQPVVWTLHDMNALTGGCHFSGSCDRFKQGCGNCPQLRLRGPRDWSVHAFEQKRQALQNINLHVVAPSRWLCDLARQSPILENALSVSRIPYGIATDQLYPVDGRNFRRQLGLADSDIVIAFGAMNVENERKGAKALLQALKHRVIGNKVRCIVFGDGEFGTNGRTSSFSENSMPPIINVGRIDQVEQRRVVFSAADAFVLPSLDDNLPLTGLEAMACGTAVIGFNSGGIPDYVIDGETGWLARSGDASHLAHRIAEATSHPDLLIKMGCQARTLIETEFRAERQVDRYIALYESIIDGSLSNMKPARRAA